MRKNVQSVLAISAALAGVSCASLAQNNGQSPQGLPPQTLIAFERAELESFIVDPRDEALKRALSMLPARIGELSGESKGQIPDQAVMLGKLALSTIARPSRFAIVYNPSDMSGGMLGYGVVMSTRFTDQRDADALHMIVQGVISSQAKNPPAESTLFAGLRETTVPGAGRLIYGPRKGADGVSYDVLAGTVKDPDQPFQNFPKTTVEGMKPFIHGIADFQALTPLMSLAQMGAGQSGSPQLKDMAQKAFESGLGGPDAMKAHFEFGYTADALRTRITVQNVMNALKISHLDTGKVLAEHFRAIPADAVWASLSLVKTQGLTEMIAQARSATEEVGEGLAKFKEQTGVDLEDDILKSLGGVGGFYTSESTGGGGILSGVAMVTFVDRAKFVAAHEKLIATAARFLKEQEFGKYIRLRSWEQDGATVFSLNFPGLPVPLEFSYAMTDQWLIAGITPQAVLAAVKQASGKGDRGILERGDLAMVKPGESDIISFQFTDLARSARDGYGWTSLAGSALSNLVRSPSDKSREPGLIVPSYRELFAKVRPGVHLAIRNGKELLLDGWSERSVLVTASGVAGIVSQIVPIAAGAAAGAALTKKFGEDFGMAIPQHNLTYSAAMTWLDMTTSGFHPIRARRLAGAASELINRQE
jgi:hypothetical protein